MACSLDIHFYVLVRKYAHLCKCIMIVLPAKIKDPTHDMNPDRKELNGKVPTMQQ